jgi:DNA topoisomerase III
MQNAWRFVNDEILRERLKQAKGIGTPATRAEIIGGLKKQGFLMTQEKNIVPTETGLALFGVLKQADPALVDPGVTAQLECLLDDVVVGKQEMVGAIDAVCDVAKRIIGKLKDGAAPGGPPLLGAGPDGRPPTPAMKRFADSIARQKHIKPPPGYAKSGAICRVFLDQHAPKKAAGTTAAELGPKPVSPAQMLYAIKVAQAKGIVIPHEVKTSSAAMSAWIDANGDAAPGKRSRKAGTKRVKSAAQKSTVPKTVTPESTAPKKRSRKRKAAADGAIAQPAVAPRNSGTDTPLRIPYGNKHDALKLGARYRSGRWYVPPGVDLSAFRERGWL